MPCFFDTNALIYAVSADMTKARRATDLMLQGGWISVQVLNETARVLRGKLRYEWAAIESTLAEIRTLLEVVPLTVEIHEHGLALAERHGFAIFDSMIVAAALRSSCETLYSEDMHHGLLVEDSLRIVNPFRE
ncbi:PIN domain-containing protein [Sphingomonas sp. DT-207]|uniref:PIN domain-containing protein n=1 Tax=Sphingomonas sp. DT-207 TaxID=3396167 RepID=UPI003F1A93BA